MDSFIELHLKYCIAKLLSEKMSEQLSGVTVVLIIGGGAILAVILFIFAKRQIMRFALRSRRGPHVPIGHDAKKSLKKEVERKIEVIPKIHYEPRLICDDNLVVQPGEQLPPYYYRFKAVDDVKLLESEILKQDSHLFRHPSESLRGYLLTSLAPAINECGQKVIHQFCDMYDHARHDPKEFQEKEYQVYQKLLLKLLDTTNQIKTTTSGGKVSPGRTLRKQKDDQLCSVLDPSRLRPKNLHQTKFKLGTENTLNVDLQPTVSVCSVPDVKGKDNETSV